jgi:hypothetical protein
MKTWPCTLVLFSLVTTSSLTGQTTDPVTFFQDKVLPILKNECYACHTGNALGGLRLDSREALLKGGKSGPAVKAGRADDSLLYQAITGMHAKFKMPPGKKLASEQVAAIRSWIESGAHHSYQNLEATELSKSTSDKFFTPERLNFWSFQPLRRPTVPDVKEAKWPRTAVDRFVLAKLEAKGLRPAPRADKRALLRRVTFDLTGLPPTADETRSFLADPSADAWEKVVDRLLASSRHGERWGRHWLDVVHYADDDGISLEADPFVNAWRYRDWVIAAFNEDMPYNLFVKAQIAGDRLDGDVSVKYAPGMGLLGLGPWYKVVEPPKAQSDEIQDRVDVITRGFLGLTVACARCHDHKYDPISNEDYYALAGVFFNTRPYEYPLARPAVVEEYNARKKTLTESEDKVKKLLEEARVRTADALAQDVQKYLVAAQSVRAKQKTPEVTAADAHLNKEAVNRWVEYLANENISHPFLKPFLAATDPETIEKEAAEFRKLLFAVVAEKKEIDAYNVKVMEEAKKSKDPYDLFCVGCNAETKTLDRNKYVLWADILSAKQRSKSGAPGVFSFVGDTLERFLSPKEALELAQLRDEVKQRKSAVPERYPFLHAVKDVDEPKDMPLQQRGNPYSLGKAVPRRFLTVLSKAGAMPLQQGSGRLDLAEAIASPSNPLTARVMVNRIWQHHFGAGLVRTPSNFGLMGDKPSHAELLDYLATQFIESGWSVKKIHREILLSEAYAMSSKSSVDISLVDPENRLLSKANRRRLDAEELRDAILSVTGMLDLKAGGAPWKWEDNSKQRTVYGTVSRFKTEKLLTLFDFPDPTMPSEQRIATNTPLQWLFFLNSSLIREASASLADKAKELDKGKGSAVNWLYEQVLGRSPETKEVAMAKTFLEESSDGENWLRLAQVLLSSNEFSFVD